MLGRRNRKGQPTVYDRLFRYGEFLGFGELHIKIKKELGLRAIIAIHNTTRGPAIGGCRCIRYNTSEDALEDVLRLAQLMSYKSAVHNLPHGGAKSVIIAPDHIEDRKAFFEAFGDFVHSFDGEYVAAEDSGTTVADMDVIASRTPYVVGTSKNAGGYGDPSVYTAWGVRRGIEAAVKFKLDRDSLDGIRIAIQGAGHVGYRLIKELHPLGAKMTVCDVNKKAVDRCVDEFGVDYVEDPEAIYSVDCDVFAPCALGAIISVKNVSQLTAKIVAGAANNQLAHHHHGQLLYERNILYAPDFVINAGGLIHVAAGYDGHVEEGNKDIEGIYDVLMNVFEKATAKKRPVNVIAEKIAEKNMELDQVEPSSAAL